MSEDDLKGFIQTGAYPIDAVPYPLFAKMVGRKETAIKTMIEERKLPLVEIKKPGSAKEPVKYNKAGNPIIPRADNWIYLPAFNAGMRKAFFEQPKEYRDAWLLWLGL
ncbi:TPA: hypothetical protein G9F27_004949 [Salmonella enterica]|uniref:Cox protein n=1 Tax=Salmonella enterica TaxID=28901 RepID=A0A743P448_SALER|nr:hypothetical protein [Salmonella enterica]